MTSTAAGHCPSKQGPWASRVFSYPTLPFLPFLDFCQISPILSPTYIWATLFALAQLSSRASHSPPCCQPAPSRPIPRRQAELYKTYIRWCGCIDENLFLAPHWFQGKVQKLRQTSGGLFSSCSPMLNWIMGNLALPRVLQTCFRHLVLRMPTRIHTHLRCFPHSDFLFIFVLGTSQGQWSHTFRFLF